MSIYNVFFDITKDENKLLKAVHADLQVQSYLCGCRALGLINKFITGPLWRLLESGIHVLDLNKHYQHMASLFASLAIDAGPFLKGEVVFFEGIKITKDSVFDSLVTPSSILDESTKQCLEIIFGSLCIITKRMLHDQLEGGKYDNPDSTLKTQTVSVNTTNNIAERNFGMLDRLIREKPNANLITYESIIMCRTNNMSEWRDSLTSEKRAQMMKWARESTAKQYEDFKARRIQVLKQKNEKRLQKIEEIKKKETRLRIVKEKLCIEISKHGGLWMTEESVDEKLKEYETESAKRAVLKCQLQFRQKVILSSVKNCSVDKKLFVLSEKGENKSIEKLIENLKSVMRQLREDNNLLQKSAASNFSQIIPVGRLIEEKERLKELYKREEEKLSKKFGPPKPKKIKLDNSSKQTPFVTSAEEIIGKRVEHLTFDYNGKEKWFTGTVICQKADNESELVIRYDCENTTFYSFPYSDYENGNIRLLPVSVNDFIGKNIKQKFVNDHEEDCWWETGRVISVDSLNNFVVNFFDSDVDFEEDEVNNVYEVLSLPLLDDYLNHDVHFF